MASSKDKIKSLLISKGQATNGEIAALFSPGEPGCFSWPQRTRELRQEFAKDGVELRCEPLSRGTFIYKLIKPKLKLEGQQFVMV
jgi:hypothetical protein